MENSGKPVANPSVLLREEFDDWAVLYDPDTGHGFGLSPTGVYLWKLLDGEHSIDEMLRALRRDAADVPEEAGEQILAFVEELTQHGLAAYDAEQFHDGRERRLPLPTGIAENLPDGGREAGQLRSGMLRYERPRLELLTLERRAQGLCALGRGRAPLGLMMTRAAAMGIRQQQAVDMLAIPTVAMPQGGNGPVASAAMLRVGVVEPVPKATVPLAAAGVTCNSGNSGGACTYGGIA